MIEQDILIIGSGVAGMTAAQYAARAGRSVTLLESIAPGGQTMYIDMIENYPGIDKPISGYEIGMKFHTQAEAFGANLVYATVSSLKKKGDIFTAETADGETYQAKAVIFATGAKHHHLGVEGEERYNGKGVSYCGTCDGPFFKGKKILVVGGGDTALTDAIYLSKLSEHVTLIHRKDRFRAQEHLVKQIERNKNIERVMQHTVERINGDGNKVTSVLLNDLANNKQYEREFDAVFIFVGMIPQTELLDKSVLNESGYILTNERMETAIPGLYAAGDVRDTVFRQLVTAASDGAIAAHCASEYIDELEGNAYR
ncbi:MAG: thioredoxin reductase [Sphaerochaeta sp.]|jgi:thioredoxin reductase (NADPH)|uniref:Thioredoxin reductase n=1 Tax=Sphaerochaeta halotolerans TaxID=2293840 RepID=A0A372MJ96_9SPIR|nr:thioredoxin-disulfide reductase [Sphaerochaeta halotolerans]MDK2859880.1 thioredoxin reductase [Sphaerochaeta sp.]MDN5333285.1 thioredoxin reductase [Sphaerochaeta sp.]RFU95386.1 thioredoxin-disulfide reductase [Sphaerochaeta halotolerans]